MPRLVGAVWRCMKAIVSFSELEALRVLQCRSCPISSHWHLSLAYQDFGEKAQLGYSCSMDALVGLEVPI